MQDYLTDLSFCFALNTESRINYDTVFENIVYSYARARGCGIGVERIGKLECNFFHGNSEMSHACVRVVMTIVADRFIERSPRTGLNGHRF